MALNLDYESRFHRMHQARQRMHWGWRLLLDLGILAVVIGVLVMITLVLCWVLY